MFVTSISIPSEKSSDLKSLISTLTEFRHALGGRRVEGLLDAVLLRSKGDANLLLSVWSDRRAMEKFVSSEMGAQFSKRVSEAVADHNVSLDEYRATWRLVREG